MTSYVNRHMLWTQYCVTLDEVLPLFKTPPHPPPPAPRESKKTQPEHDTLPKTVWETYFCAQHCFVVRNGES